METKRTGDFGADIVAEKSELVYVVQCKWRGKPVGVSAVQEIVAARSYYVANFSAVVPRTKYTDEAVQLARANQVALLGSGSQDNLESMFN